MILSSWSHSSPIEPTKTHAFKLVYNLMRRLNTFISSRKVSISNTNSSQSFTCHSFNNIFNNVVNLVFAEGFNFTVSVDYIRASNLNFLRNIKNKKLSLYLYKTISEAPLTKSRYPPLLEFLITVPIILRAELNV